jgi:YD repeat-containing protein
MNIRNYSSGQLLNHELYKLQDGSFVLQRETANEYTTLGRQLDTVGLYIQPQVKRYGGEVLSPSNGAIIKNHYHYFDIIAESGIKKVTKNTVTDYFADGSQLTETIEYKYDNSHNLITKETRRTSDGSTLINETTYPFNYNSFPDYQSRPNVYPLMVSKNMYNFPVETVTKLNGQVTGASINTYATGDGVNTQGGESLIYLSSKYILNIDKPVSDYKPLSKGNSTTLQTLDARCTQEEQYRYYSNGNIREIINSRNGTTTTVLWGYNRQYPVAVIENAEYNHITAHINEATINDIANRNQPTTNDLNTLNNLRSRFPDSHVTTNTYKPLAGITSTTDPRGITTYYQYDNSGRLSETYIIEDGIKKYINKYKYNYAK